MRNYRNYKKQNSSKIISIILIVAILIGGAFLVYKYFPKIKSWFVSQQVVGTTDTTDTTDGEDVNLGGGGGLGGTIGGTVGGTAWTGELPSTYDFDITIIE